MNEYLTCYLICIGTNPSFLLKPNLVSNLMLVLLPLFPSHTGVFGFVNPRGAQHLLRRCCLSLAPCVAGFLKISVEWCSWCLITSPCNWTSLVNSKKMIFPRAVLLIWGLRCLEHKIILKDIHRGPGERCAFGVNSTLPCPFGAYCQRPFPLVKLNGLIHRAGSHLWLHSAWRERGSVTEIMFEFCLKYQ